MLTRARIKNFKAWRDTGDIRLAPLTVIFGGNSAGKSSLGHLLLALKQTALLSDRKRALHLGDPSSLIDLGTFADCLYGHDLNQKMEFALQWKLPSPLHVKNTLDPKEIYQGDELSLDAVLRAGKAKQPEIERIRYALILTRLQRRVAEGVIAPKDVAIYFCRRSEKSAELESLRLDLYGNIENWPDNPCW